MNIQIREYNSEDKSLISDAFIKLYEYIVSIDPIKRLRKTPEYAEHALREFFETVENQEGKIYIAEDNGKFAGFISGFTMKQSEEDLREVIPSKLGEVSDIYVEEGYRSHGVGSLLIEKLEEHLINMGCDAIWISIVAFNTGAHKFYNKHGYTDREVGLLKKV